MMEDRFEEFLKQAAGEYHPPPETPRERMWSRIQAERALRRRRADRRHGAVRQIWSAPWVRWGIGLAAALVIGIGLGRMSLRETPPFEPAVAEREIRGAGDLAYRLLTTAHFTRAEALLTSFRADPERAAEVGGDFRRRAGELLTSTRLLLDSPVARDPVLRSLLEDLEVVLVQVRQVATAGEGRSGEIDLINEGLVQRELLFKLRSTIPAGPGAARASGVS